MTEKDYTADVFAAIADPKKHVIVQTAPAVRAGLGEEFGLPIGTDVEGKMAAALRRLGFDKVFDTNFSADLTITEAYCLSSPPAPPDGLNTASTISRT